MINSLKTPSNALALLILAVLVSVSIARYTVRMVAHLDARFSQVVNRDAR